MKVTPELISYSESKIEIIVRDLLKRRPDVRDCLPINLELLVENTPNVTLVLEPGLLQNFRVVAGIFKDPKTHEIAIAVDAHFANGKWCDYYEVLGEELGHLELHQSLFIQVHGCNDFIDLQKTPEWFQFERDARRFSRAIRMPAELFISESQKTYGQVVQNFGFGQQVFRHMQYRLAKRFETSLDDAERRMSSPILRITDRIRLSLAASSTDLLPANANIFHIPPYRQREFSGEGFDLNS